MTTVAASSAADAVKNPAYRQLVDHVVDAALIGASQAILAWDEDVMMPAGGVELRSRQLAQLAGLRHERMTDPKLDELLHACEDDADITGDPLAVPAVNVRELRRDYDRRTKLPAELVEHEARLTSRGRHVWAEARKNNDFNAFLPTLTEIIDLLRRKAACYGWAEGGEAWDALAEDYEPGCTAQDVEKVFTPLRQELQVLLDDLMGSSTPPSNAFNEAVAPIEQQRAFVKMVSEKFGFDYTRGRLDTSTHPFCSGSHPHDVRLTTRFRDTDLNDALGSTMHEAGHGIYEQGLPNEHWGTPMADPVSLGIHESQSRMWENQVGRSIPFWKWCYPEMQTHFGDAFATLSFDEVFGGANIVRPSLIRVEADEATYNMHIMMRFEIERGVLAGAIDARDIPEIWNAKYKEYLAVDVPDDARGCLQDIHWSMGAMGYFPTYTLGNLYAAQFFEAAHAAIPDLETQFERGGFDALRGWLNGPPPPPGRRYRAADLCKVVTGQPLSAEPLLRHLNDKLRPLYGV